MPDTADAPDVVAALQEANARLRAENAELKAQIARLERLISRNSGNSSMPPSTDDLPGKTPPGRRTGRGGMKRKPGKQPGAPGAFLAWNEPPDKTEDVFAEGICRAALTWPTPAAWGWGTRIRSLTCLRRGQ